MELDGAGVAFKSELAALRLLHLSDSALPIGALAHSFGIETLRAEGLLKVSELPNFLSGYLQEAGLVEAVFCRAAFRLVDAAAERLAWQRWVEINDILSALKPARESRATSAALGQNFLMAVLAVGEFPMLRAALEATRRASSSAHHAPAFGLASRVLELNEDRAVAAYLHQSVASLVSACQRLMPLGQTDTMRILWNLKPAMIDIAVRSAACTLDDVCGFTPLVDWSAMEHPALPTRLFIS